MNEDNGMEAVQNVCMKRQKNDLSETVHNKTARHENANDSTWRRIRPEAVELSHSNIKHFEREISTEQNPNFMVNRQTLQTVQDSHENRDILLAKTNVDEVFMKNKISGLGTSEKTEEIVSTDDECGKQNASIISKNEKTAVIQNVINKQDVPENTTAEPGVNKKKVEDVEHDSTGKKSTGNFVEFNLSKNENSGKVVEDKRHATPHRSFVTKVDSGKVNYSLFANTRPQTGQILHKDFTIEQLQLYLEEELYESEISLTKETSSSCNGNQKQEINLDDFVEISLEERGSSNDTTMERTHETSSIYKTHGKLCCLTKCLKRLRCTSSTQK